MEAINMRRWITATVDEEYTNEESVGIDGLDEGDTVLLYIDEKGNRTWEKM